MSCLLFSLTNFVMSVCSLKRCRLLVKNQDHSTQQEQAGWSSGKSTRLHQWVRSGFKSLCRNHMWVEFVVGYLPCSEKFLSGYSSFPQKPTLQNSNSIMNAQTRLKCFVGKQITITITITNSLDIHAWIRG